MPDQATLEFEPETRNSYSDPEELSADATSVESEHISWSDLSYPEGFQYYEACEGEDGETFVYPETVEDWIWERCQGPMMNYRYRLPRFREDPCKAARKLEGLPLCIVHICDSDEYYLALTGGGMDLSEEICMAYMKLGYLPPTDLCDLPRMAGRDYSESPHREVVEACRRSLEISQARAGRQMDRLDGLTN